MLTHRDLRPPAFFFTHAWPNMFPHRLLFFFRTNHEPSKGILIVLRPVQKLLNFICLRQCIACVSQVAVALEKSLATNAKFLRRATSDHTHPDLEVSLGWSEMCFQLNYCGTISNN